MKMIDLNFNVKRLAVAAAMWLGVTLAWAQQQEPAALMAYPQAPDSCTSLESRTNYVLAHFWDNFDFGKPITDDAALVKTFRDYADLFRFGHRNVVKSSIRDFMFKLRAVSGNVGKVGRVAELVLYSPMADYWSDEAYVEFAKSIAMSTTLDREVREYYSRQIGLISACQEGMELQLAYTDAVTKAKTDVSALDSVTTVILFIDDGIDSRIARTMLDSDLGCTTLLQQGVLQVLCLYDGTPPDDWADTLPVAWRKGFAPRIEDRIDLRMLPACFVVDANHKIIQKNMTIDELKSALN